MIELEDPFANYPELRKEREKAKRIREYEEHGVKGRGGYRPNAGAPKKDQKTIVFKLLINKVDEPFVMFELEKIRGKYGN